MFMGVGIDDRSTAPIVRHLRQLLSVMVSRFGRCVVVKSPVYSKFADQKMVLFDTHKIRLIHVDGVSNSEIVMDFDEDKLTELGREINMGFVVAFGNEIERIVGDLFSEHSKLYSIGNPGGKGAL